jgi:hypothetical protein
LLGFLSGCDAKSATDAETICLAKESSLTNGAPKTRCKPVIRRLKNKTTVDKQEKNAAQTPKTEEKSSDKSSSGPNDVPAGGENRDAKQKDSVAKSDDEEEEKPMTDEEVLALRAERRKAALKEVIDTLGEPLVDNADDLKKMNPLFPVWIDMKNKRVVVQGVVCQTNAPLEMFAVVTGTKEHEAILSIPIEAKVVHAALLAVGAEAGQPVQFGPNPTDYKPATGSEIEITLKWKNDKGELQTARAQEWIKNVKTGKPMEHNWVFGGSGFWKDEKTGVEYYKAEGGDFICVSNFPSAMLDLPIESSQSNDELLFQANSERIPPRGTPVTMILHRVLKVGMVTPRIIINEEEEENLGIPTGP